MSVSLRNAFLLLVTPLLAALVSCARQKQDTSEAEAVKNRTQLAVDAETFLELHNNYKSFSNTICRLPVFTKKYDDVIATLAGDYSHNWGKTLTEYELKVGAQLKATDIINEIAKDPTKVKEVTLRLTKEFSDEAIRRMMASSPDGGQAIRMAAQRAGVPETDFVRDLILRNKLFKSTVDRTGEVLSKFKVTGLNAGPYQAGGAFVAKWAGRVFGLVNTWGYLCDLSNVLAAGMYWAYNDSLSRLGAIDTANRDADVCIILNSIFAEDLAGGFPNTICKRTAVLDRFARDGKPNCHTFEVISDVNEGAVVYSTEYQTHGKFRVGKGMDILVLSGKKVGKRIIARVQVLDGSFANQQGWMLVGGLKPILPGCR